MKNIVLLLILFALLSCSKKYEVTDFPSFTTIELEKESLIDEGCYFDMMCIADSVVLLKAECDTFFFHLYNSKDLRFIDKLGEKGQGPGDFQFPFPYNNVTTKYTQSDTIVFFDMNLVCNKYINVKNILEDTNGDNIRQEYLDEMLFYGKDLNFVKNNIIIGNDINESKGLFFLYNKDCRDLKWIDFYPKISADKRYLTSIYSGVICANENKNTIAFGYRHFDGVSFYSMSGELKKAIFFTEPILPKLSLDFSGVSNKYPVYFSKIYGTPDRCYLMRIGRSLDDILNGSGLKSTIIEFDWEGTILNAFQFDNILSSFCVDENGEYLYGVYSSDSVEDPYVHLLKFEIRK